MQNVEINPYTLSNQTLANTADTISACNPVLPASNAWPESSIACTDVVDIATGADLPFVDSIANLCIVSAIIILFLFAFSRIMEGIFAIASSVFNAKKLLAIERQANLYGSRNVLLVFSLIVSVFIFINDSLTKNLIENNYPLGIRFLLVFIVIILYFTARYIVFKVMDWVNRKPVFKYINRFYYTHAILSILLLTLGFLFLMIFPNIPVVYIRSYTIGIASFTLLLYFTRGYQLIISNGFSHFFWILYLCTLEILPSIAILHLILS